MPVREPRDGKITLGEWLAFAERRVPELVREVVEGEVRAAALKGLGIPGDSVRIVQRPVRWDFAADREGPVLQAPR